MEKRNRPLEKVTINSDPRQKIAYPNSEQKPQQRFFQDRHHPNKHHPKNPKPQHNRNGHPQRGYNPADQYAAKTNKRRVDPQMRFHPPNNKPQPNMKETANFGRPAPRVPQTPSAPKNKPYIQNKIPQTDPKRRRDQRRNQPPLTPPRNPLGQGFKKMRDYSPSPMYSRAHLLAGKGKGINDSISNIFNDQIQKGQKRNKNFKYKGRKGTYIFMASRLNLFQPSDSRVAKKLKPILKRKGEERRGPKKNLTFNSEVFIYDVESYKEYNAYVVQELRRLKMMEGGQESAGGITNSIVVNKKNIQKKKDNERLQNPQAPAPRGSHTNQHYDPRAQPPRGSHKNHHYDPRAQPSRGGHANPQAQPPRGSHKNHPDPRHPAPRGSHKPRNPAHPQAGGQAPGNPRRYRNGNGQGRAAHRQDPGQLAYANPGRRDPNVRGANPVGGNPAHHRNRKPSHRGRDRKFLFLFF